MSEEKPLRVRVAEALGCRPVWGHGWMSEKPGEETWLCRCEDREHGWDNQATGCGVTKHYDTDWDATGPLIEKYGIRVEPIACSLDDGTFPCWKAAWPWNPRSSADERRTRADTPLIAVCLMVVALAAEGKLPK